MTGKIAFALAFVAAVGVAGRAGTDVFDAATNNDNGIGTSNQITHGFSQGHDLGAQPGPVADEDWYRISQQPFSSYEIVCDGLTGDVVSYSPDFLERVDIAGNVLQSSTSYEAFGFLAARGLRFANDTSSTISNEYVRVAHAFCGTNCAMGDQYRIRAWETTIAVPRYNNSGGQLTVLIIQNPALGVVSGNARLWASAGSVIPITTVAFTLGDRATAVINLASVNGGVANGTSGAITIAHDGRYGQLAVKAVALEPSTGFTFDTPGQHMPVS